MKTTTKIGISALVGVGILLFINRKKIKNAFTLFENEFVIDLSEMFV